MQEYNFTEYAQLEQAVREAKTNFGTLSDRIKAVDSRLSDISELQKHIINYSNTRAAYDAYRKSGFSKKFRSEHEAEIQLHLVAKKAFDALGTGKVPKMKSLQTEFATLTVEKKRLYQENRSARDKMQKLQTVKQNTDALLGYSGGESEREVERQRNADSKPRSGV